MGNLATKDLEVLTLPAITFYNHTININNEESFVRSSANFIHTRITNRDRGDRGHSGKMIAHARRISRFRFRGVEERLVIPAWEKFAEERNEHRFTLFGTDIDVIRPEKLLMEFVLMEKSDG